MTGFKNEFVEDIEAQVVDLSLVIARRIITDEINTRPEFIVTMVKESLKRLQRVGNIRIKINPSLYDLFMKSKPELMEVHEDITFDVDSNIPISGPLVISEIEEVVTDIESMIKNIADEIKGTDEIQADED